MNKLFTRILAAMLAVLCLVALVACGSNVGTAGETQPEVKGDEPDLTPSLNVATINDQLTWEKLNSFPLKRSDMTIDEARQLCVDYFAFYKTALWTPNVDVDFIKNSSGSDDTMERGYIYGGLPYIGLGSGTLYRLMDYMDEETGVVDVKRALKLETNEGVVSMANMKYFGNQCANGAFGGWGRVINTITSIATASMTEARGCIRLGDYEYDQEKWSETARTTAVLEANGRQRIYECYALLQPGDGLVYYTSAGHVIMCSEAAVVVRNDDNTINEDESYIYIIDQGQSWETATNAYGDNYRYKDNNGKKKSFKDLFDTNYVPFTFKEWLGTDPIEDTVCSFSLSDGKITWSQLMASTVTSNYAVSDIYAIVTNENGEEVYRHVTRSAGSGYKTLDFLESGIATDHWGTLESGTWNLEIVAQLITGERPTVYIGQLVVE